MAGATSGTHVSVNNHHLQPAGADDPGEQKANAKLFRQSVFRCFRNRPTQRVISGIELLGHLHRGVEPKHEFGGYPPWRPVGTSQNMKPASSTPRGWLTFNPAGPNALPGVASVA